MNAGGFSGKLRGAAADVKISNLLLLFPYF